MKRSCRENMTLGREDDALCVVDDARTRARTPRASWTRWIACALACGTIAGVARAGRGRARDARGLGAIEGARVAKLGSSDEDVGDGMPFRATRRAFAYERWFETYARERTPGTSARETRRDGDGLIHESANGGVVRDGDGWEGIRDAIRASGGKKKLVLMLRHGEATHNAWGETIDGELETLPCSWRHDGDLLDPSLTEVGVKQILETRAALTGARGFLQKIQGGSRGRDAIRVIASPLARAMETALIATSGIEQLKHPIVVTDYLRERLELNAPFEVRPPASLEDGSEFASEAIKESKVKHCKFDTGLKQIFGDAAFSVRVGAHEGECRVDKVKPTSYAKCKGLSLTHASDNDLGDAAEETMLGITNRVNIVLANVFDAYDEDVVLLVTHSDWIISALMELYPNTLGFVPKNGEVIPVIVEDHRDVHHTESRHAEGDKVEKEGELSASPLRAEKKASSKKKASDADEDETSSLGDSDSGNVGGIRFFDDSADASKASKRKHKHPESSLGKLSSLVANSLGNIDEHFRRNGEDESSESSESSR